MSTSLDNMIIQRISFLGEQIRPNNRPAVNKMFQLQMDVLKAIDLQKIDTALGWKKKEAKQCVNTHESEILFTEIEVLEWLQRQVKRFGPN